MLETCTVKRQPGRYSFPRKQCRIFLTSTIWFRCPEFLEKDISDWPGTENEYNTEIIERRKAVVFKCNSLVPSIIDEIINKHSSYTSCIRIITFVFRVFNRASINHSITKTDVLHIPPSELDEIFWRVISHIQMSAFASDITALSNNNVVHSTSLQRLGHWLEKQQVTAYTVSATSPN